MSRREVQEQGWNTRSLQWASLRSGWEGLSDDCRRFRAITMKILLSSHLPQVVLTILCFVLLLSSVHTVRSANGLSLKIIGDNQRGYAAVILFNGQPIAEGSGEFSAVFQNGSRELDSSIENWKATSWSGDARHLTLSGESKLVSLKVVVSVLVDYEVVTPDVVRKRIRLQQSDAHLLFYQIKNRLQPVDSNAKSWSFDRLDCKGGPLHEYFPAAGFRTSNGLTVGLLTDSGFRNYWNRIIRRDNGEFVKPAPNEISDVNLEYVSPQEERAKGPSYVGQTFGEELVRAPLPEEAVQ